MKLITSRENALFKHLKKLAESSRERRKTGQTLLDGTHLLASFLEAGGVPEQVFFSRAAMEQREIRTLVENTPEERLIELPHALFAEISPVDTPTGLLSIIDVLHFKKPERVEFCILLEDVQDPGNLGTILRTSAAAGVQVAYLSSRCADAWSPKVLRAGMGAHFILPIEERSDLLSIASAFEGITLATALSAENSLYDTDLTMPVALIVGNEGAGLSDALLSVANTHVRIPMPGKIESLNAAAAASICLYERVRQTRC